MKPEGTEEVWAVGQVPGIATGVGPGFILRRDEDGHALVRNGDRVSDLRSRLSGWHFAKEMLTDTERAILYCAEQVLGILDENSPGGYCQ